ncbi:hypothetical protein [Metabacillus fastidiosus]|uniref:Uncharacterized protein n=1 Tax=Metabacillus fastidiosus TaxID=1458 RepID=A0ABU6P3Z9_9BACI|nr:hypothetical protein [Metabacillus fastidiosus]MED4404084.1 hypothetical protein [Metabacillus fastidiosus]
MKIHKPFFLALWASSGLKVIAYSMIDNWALAASNTLYMLLWAWILQVLFRREEHAE